MILLIDNYDSFTYNLYQVIATFGSECRVVRNDALTIEEIQTMAPKRIVLSPGPGTPDEAGLMLKIIETFAGKIPLLGVCLGHQAIGQAFGGKVVRAPTPKHGKLSRVLHQNRGAYVEFANPFVAARYHSLVVDRASLPDCFEITCETREGLIMGIRHRQLAVEGVQFHPESIATPDGATLLQRMLAS